MSAKWHRSRAWDDQHLTGALRPVKLLFRAFSSISLAVVLLILVAIYGTLASVPIGLVALAPTYLLYALTLLGLVAACALLPASLVRRALRTKPMGLRVPLVIVIFLAGLPLAAWLWLAYAWPGLRYDPETGKGLLLFADFVDANRAVTLRRLPGMEMSELEFYAWWPLRLILLTFVANLAVATVRRIEFDFKHIGVLTVHTGIITIALGSVYYAGLKREGDTLLVAGQLDPVSGKPGLGPPQRAFFDNTRVALYVNQGRGWEQRPLAGVPRYNNYNLAAFSGESAAQVSGRDQPWTDPNDRGPLNLRVMDSPGERVSSGVRLRIVGYAAYAEPVDDFLRVEPAPAGIVRAGDRLNPLRIVFLHSDHPDDAGRVSKDPVLAFNLAPASPAGRISGNSVFSLEYTADMPASRWNALAEELPGDAEHALVVEIPSPDGAPPFRAVYPVRTNQDVKVADTGWSIRVKDLAPEPPFPIITKGYEGSHSSVAILTVKSPAGESFDRWVYHRFPEIAQDLLPELNERGMPKRRDADPRIRITLVEADHLAVYIDDSNGKTRALVRQPHGKVKLYGDVPADGWLRDIVPMIHLRIGAKWDDALKVDRPRPVPAAEQEKDSIGTHDKAMLAVEVTMDAPHAAGAQQKPFRQIVWLPFTRYMGAMQGGERSIDLPDGTLLSLAFGRRQWPLPGFDIRLADFEMIAYDHRGAPRDYQSMIRVEPTGDSDFEPFVHVTKLNNPLRAPTRWRDDRSWFTNVIARLAGGLSPNQYKLSQAGWDAAGWDRTQKAADAGQLQRPFVQFTILGVGNNPGIHIVALGGVLMGLGIPWAFYLKPWLVQREKRRIQRQLAAGAYARPARAPAPVLNGHVKVTVPESET